MRCEEGGGRYVSHLTNTDMLQGVQGQHSTYVINLLNVDDIVVTSSGGLVSKEN